ncbi:MAG: hypothetical protein ACTH4Y_08295 [Microbacterium gubbeenense]|uniref:hypothetical protein n=1 Tax=Microbacterium gubbeenense TaxID=159896 RepID=UPI003F953A00
MSYQEKIETLLGQTEAAFELTQDELTRPEDLDKLWQRASYRLSLAQAYIGLEQVRNVASVAGSVERSFEQVELAQSHDKGRSE